MNQRTLKHPLGRHKKTPEEHLEDFDESYATTIQEGCLGATPY